MKRLVYAPRAYAFIKDANGNIRDVSRYIVSGNVNRLLMQVSSAELTLRNPKMLFTTPDEKGRVAFSPMDPITIFLKRVHGRPVRVFTGFLDRTPYITLYPGTISLRASCTLKRLLYSYFDPALPYTQSFLAEYGWLNLNDGSVYSPNAWREQPSKTISGKVLYVGDGLGAGTVPELEKAAGKNKITNKTALGTSSAAAAQVVESLVKGNTYSYVVFDAGTGDETASAVQASLDRVKAAAKGLPILVYTIKGPGAKEKNAMLRNYPGITLVDWAKKGETGQTAYDVDTKGYQSRADLVYTALKDNSVAGTDDTTTTSKSNLNEGSFSTLLFETLKQIGRWDPDTILIERLPDDLFTRMSELYMQITEDQGELKKVVDDLMRKIVGEGDFAGPTQGDVDLSGIDGTVPETVYKVGLRMKAPEKHLIAAMMTGLVEAPIQGGKSFGNPKGGDLTGVPGAPTTRQSAGWRQETVASYPGVDRNNVPESAERFFNECKQLDRGQDAGELAADVQRPQENLRYKYNAVRSTAMTLLRKLEQTVGKEADATDFGAPATGGFPEDGQTQDAKRRDGREDKSKTSTGKLTSPLKNLAAASIGVGGGAYGAARGYGGHAGVDMPASYGQTLYAMTDGVVTYAGSWGSEGQLVVIKSTQKVDNYPEGFRMGYGHMSSLTVSKGDEVRAGDPIGGAGHGSNGQNHLHLFVRQDDQPTNGSMDPTPLVKAAAQGEQPSKGPGSSTSGGGTDDATDVTNFGGAAAFASTFNFPTLMESLEAVALQGEKSLMNDKPLLPFIQQLCEASLREFQSMPDGSFFAFYPDYFGEMYHRPPYWEIDDIEILDGKVELSDDALTTHYYVVGDTSGVGNQQMNNLLSAGVVTVFNVFMANSLLTTDDKSPREKKKGKEKGPNDLLLSADEAAQFLNRYGARPQVDNLPMIRHPYFEMFLAYQRFMLAWSKQFSTPFSFTFMPELYPGGKVGFPDHNLQMYIEEVNHTFDYTSGFTTTATLSAPSVYAGKNSKIENTNLPPRMVRAIIEPSTGN